ncbi:MAG: type II secretion system minor pseudopilin GspJ [Psychromonas sp.]|nr:type II secretion system minor pseudopilin GspJ [Psychromonas sp.]
MKTKKNFGSREGGFTLIEIIIAIAIFAALSLAGYQILQGVIRSNDISKVHNANLHKLQRSMLIIEQDFTQIVARKLRDETIEQDQQGLLRWGNGLFSSTDQGIEFTRLGWSNLLNILPRSNLLRVRYLLIDGNLERQYFLYPDIIAGQEPYKQILFSDVSKLSFRFWDKKWIDTWSKKNSLPEGIEISFTSKKYGVIRRLFIISAGNYSK